LQRDFEHDEANVTSVTAQRFKALQLEVEKGLQEQQGIMEQIPSKISRIRRKYFFMATQKGF
jgi:hypothetical protein